MSSARRSGSRRSSRRRPRWADWSDAELLELRMCDLGLELRGTWLEDMIAQVLDELAARDLSLRPHFWLSEEWFSPEGVPGVALPFYLAHPRLVRLERAQVLEVEGGSRSSCLKILRHECGHAVQHGYRLHRRRRWQRHFGRSSDPYPEYYRPNPASKRHVVHLDHWYAQSHPDEDFAETFAVWLRPGSRWRSRYAGWPALEKIEYVDELMAELSGVRPPVRTRSRPEELGTLRKSLGEHYREKRERYAVGHSAVFDADLLEIFERPEGRRGESAVGFLRRHRSEIRGLVARWTGEYAFTVDQLFRDMMTRCRQLRLRAVGSREGLKTEFAVLLTVRTMQYLHHRREWHAL